jgi:tetratricopeptide (TPR) repeat protein
MRREASGAVGRAGGRGTPKKPASKARRQGVRQKERRPGRSPEQLEEWNGTGADAHKELVAAVGERRASHLQAELREATDAYRGGRYADARRILRKVVRDAPGATTVRELLGITLYRLGSWREAARELEAFRELTGSVEQDPVLADTYRALGRHAEVEALWDAVREASPSAALVAEARIVMAGSLADQGDAEAAIRVLAAGRWQVSRPKDHHLRMAYALADLYDRAGDVPRARETFAWVARHDPRFFDVAERLSALD